MTFQQYIENPLGKKNAVFSQREMFRAQYTQKFDALYLKEAGSIRYHLYHDKAGDAYFCHVMIPSETVKDFYYDVVVKFTTNNNALRVANNLHEYDVKFFSNDPAFVFTYARVFLKNDMFIEELKSRAPKLSLKKDPNERNPYQIPGYVKSIYFTFLFMRQKGLFSKTMYTTAGERYSKSTLVQRVRPFDVVMAERKEKEEKQKKEKKRQAAGQSTPTQTKPPKQTQSMKGVNKLVNQGGRMGKTAKRVKPGPRVMKTRGFIKGS